MAFEDGQLGELKDLAAAHDKKVETQQFNFNDLNRADERMKSEARDVLRIAREASPKNPDKFILEAIAEYAKTEKIPLLAAKAQVLQYLSPEYKAKVDAEVKEYFTRFDLNAFVALKAGSPESNEAIETLKILRDEGYMPYFVIAVHYQDDPVKKEAILKKYDKFTKTIKVTLKKIERVPFNTKEAFVLNPTNTFPEARKYFESMKKSQPKDKYEYAIGLAYRYLIIGRDIEAEFGDFDCDETTLLLQKTALDESLEIGNYLTTVGHAVLKLDGLPLVLDTYDIKIRSVEECARGEGYGENSRANHFWKDNKGEYLAQYEEGDSYPKKITGFRKVENNPHLVTPDSELTALVFERADLLKSMGRKEEAKLHREKALEIDPNDADAHDGLAILLESMGEKEEAKLHYERALAINPNDAEVHFNLAILLYNIGDYPNSRIHLNAFYKLRKGGYEDYYKFLEEYLTKKGY